MKIRIAKEEDIPQITELLFRLTSYEREIIDLPPPEKRKLNHV